MTVTEPSLCTTHSCVTVPRNFRCASAIRMLRFNSMDDYGHRHGWTRAKGRCVFASQRQRGRTVHRIVHCQCLSATPENFLRPAMTGEHLRFRLRVRRPERLRNGGGDEKNKLRGHLWNAALA